MTQGIPQASDRQARPDDRGRDQGRPPRNGIVLDLFGGSGSTLIAAHKTGRRAYLCELDPLYCNHIIRRWEAYAKDEVVQLVCGMELPTLPLQVAAE
jgi:hypothetical protein